MDGLPKPYTRGSTDNVLIIGDTHEPFCKKGYLEFCRQTQERFKCGIVVHIGDEVDNNALSYFDPDPDGYSPGMEADIAQKKMNDWYAVFPSVKVCIGNHTALPYRKALASGIPRKFLKKYEEIWESPEGWQWQRCWTIHDVLYTHGSGSSCDRAAINRALNMRQPVVQGHIHTAANIHFNVSPRDRLWGMQVGCGIDRTAYAMAYSRDDTKNPVISCGVVLNKGALPMVVPM